MNKAMTKCNKNGYKRKSIILLSSIVILLTAIIVAGEYFGYCINQLDHEIQITINSELKRKADEEYIIEKYEKSTQTYVEYLFDYCAYYLAEYGVNTDNLNSLTGRIPINIYYSTVEEKDKIRTITAIGSDCLELTDKNLAILFEKGSLECDEDGEIRYYIAKRVEDGYLVASYMIYDLEDGIYDIGKPYTAKQDEALFWADDNSVITSSNIDGYENRLVSEVIKDSHAETDIEVCNVEAMGLCLVKKQAKGNNKLYAILPIGNLGAEVIRSAMVPVTLLLVVFFMILIFVIKVKRDESDIDNSSKRKYIKITKKIILDRMIASHIITMALFGIILIGMTMFYVSALISYSNQSIIANQNLSGLSDNYDRACNNLENSEMLLEDELISYGNYIACGFLANPDTLNSDALNKMVNYIPAIVSINVTDATATIVASTTNDEGYSLGKNDTDINENCWKIMDGVSDYAVCKRGDSSNDVNIYSVLLRRQDAKGVIIIDFMIDESGHMGEKWTLAEIMLTTDMGDATCITFQQENPEQILIAEPDASEIIYLDSKLDEKVTTDGYTGFLRVRGIRYFMTTLYDSDNDVCFISALPTKKIPYSAAVYCLITIVIGMIVFIVILLMGACRVNLSENADNNESDDDKKSVPESADLLENGKQSIKFRSIDNLMDERFKNDIRNMIIINGVLLVLLLGLDYIIQDKPLLEYLLSSQWNKGLNLFSVTMIILVMVSCAFLGFVMNKLIMLIFSNMGPRGMTVGNLLSSLMRFAFLVVAVLWSLKELGLNMSALIAGAGIAGAAISFCASATINDLISGFFIVFEGSFKIGDWIKVDDWRGEVVSIGIRTTKLACSDCIKILNNSTLTNVTVLDRTNCGALAKIEVAYKENVEAVIELLNNSREIFVKEIPEIQDGPFVRGVADLGTNGVCIEMYALGAQEHVAKIERGIRLVAKRLFDENNIEIPFAQVTIHNQY